MHTDKYGRTWRFKPGHDADSMVQVPWDVMAQFMAADRILTNGVGAEIWMNTEFAKARPDCYILKSGEHLYTGARYSDEPGDYHSSCTHNKAVLDAVVWYLWKRTTPVSGNGLAILDLIGRPEAPVQCW